MPRVRDLTGKKFGRLTYLCESTKRYRGQIVAKFRCDCGNMVFLGKYAVTSGHTISCGCWRKEVLKKGQRGFKDISGKRFGRVLVLYRVDDGKQGQAIWLCLCDCGTIVEIPGVKLIGKRKSSCGCLQKDSIMKFHESKREMKIGRKVGRLKAVECTENKVKGEFVFKYSCDCGGYVLKRPSKVGIGKTMSCGCLAKENIKVNAQKKEKERQGENTED